MSQHPLAIPSGSGLSVRQGFNNAIDSLATLHSGPAAPAAPQAFQLWADSSTGMIKVRNPSNTAWLPLSQMIGANYLGIGEGWDYVTVTASRAIGVTYTNTTGYPMFVMLNGGLSSGAILSSVVAGSPTELMSNPGTFAAFASRMSFYVPAGATYQVQNLTGGTITSMLWIEYKKGP